MVVDSKEIMCIQMYEVCLSFIFFFNEKKGFSFFGKSMTFFAVIYLALNVVNMWNPFWMYYFVFFNNRILLCSRLLSIFVLSGLGIRVCDLFESGREVFFNSVHFN